MTVKMEIKKTFLLILSFVSTLNCTAQDIHGNGSSAAFISDTITSEVPWENKILGRIGDIMDSYANKTSMVGMEIYDLSDNKVIYAYNERQTMRPASTQKILTAVTAIDHLGCNYEYKTQLCYTGDIDGRTLIGSVYCIGGFDPAFTVGDLDSFGLPSERPALIPFRATSMQT